MAKVDYAAVVSQSDSLLVLVDKAVYANNVQKALLTDIQYAKRSANQEVLERQRTKYFVWGHVLNALLVAAERKLRLRGGDNVSMAGRLGKVLTKSGLVGATEDVHGLDNAVKALTA